MADKTKVMMELEQNSIELLIGLLGSLIIYAFAYYYYRKE